MTEVPVADGTDHVLAALRSLGVEIVFGLPGVHNLALWRALASSEIRLVCVRHEQSAVYAADGYARATGDLGVALVTTGPGAANTIAATGEAMASGSPVLVLATDIPTTLRRPGVVRGVLHETRDQTALFVPVTKHAQLIEAAGELGPALSYAGARARAAPSGPVYVGIPTDFLTTKVTPTVIPSPPDPLAFELEDHEVARASTLLTSARSPLIWAGGGALRADAGPLVGEIATRIAAPVITTYSSRGLVAPDHPCYVPGPVHSPEVGGLWDEADVVLAVGTDFDAMMTQNWRMPSPSTLISINVSAEDASKNYQSDITLLGDARDVLSRISGLIGSRPGLQILRSRLADAGDRLATWMADDEPQAVALLDALDDVVPPDSVVVADMCVAGYWLAGFRHVTKPRTLAYPVGWGTLGFAFPASIGAALASAIPTVCVCGDGGFLFACGELATVAELRIPLTIVLVDDGGYGMLRFDQEHAGQRAVGVDLPGPDFVALARSFGLSACRVNGFGREFEQALGSAISVGGPTMVVVDATLKPPPTTSPRWYRSSPAVPARNPGNAS